MIILDTKQLKIACNKILTALDNTDVSDLMELVELKSENNKLYMNVTNKEYYVSTVFDIPSEENFNVTIKADTFLNLINQCTTENVEIEVKENHLSVKANGKYKVPFVFDNDKMKEIPLLDIENKTCEMNIDTEILKSIMYYNIKELSKGVIVDPTIQKLHYLDEQGALTFTTGACVNRFTLEKPIKILLTNKIVKLFKLFETDSVKFSLGHDIMPGNDEIIQTKIKLEAPDVSLTAILNCDSTLFKAIPVDLIRQRVNDNYPFTVSVSKTQLLQTLNRMAIFIKPASKLDPMPAIFEFNNNKIMVWDKNKENCEEVDCTAVGDVEYTCVLDIKDMKLTLDTCNEPYLSICFGNGQAILINRLNIANVLPELE